MNSCKKKKKSIIMAVYLGNCNEFDDRKRRECGAS